VVHTQVLGSTWWKSSIDLIAFFVLPLQLESCREPFAQDERRAKKTFTASIAPKKNPVTERANGQFCSNHYPVGWTSTPSYCFIILRTPLGHPYFRKRIEILEMPDLLLLLQLDYDSTSTLYVELHRRASHYSVRTGTTQATLLVHTNAAVDKLQL